MLTLTSILELWFGLIILTGTELLVIYGELNVKDWWCGWVLTWGEDCLIKYGICSTIVEVHLLGWLTLIAAGLGNDYDVLLKTLTPEC